jgi:hypothetical protein
LEKCVKIRVFELVRTREKKIAYRVLVGKPEGKILLARLRCRWGNNSKVDLKVIGWRHLRIV